MAPSSKSGGGAGREGEVLLNMFESEYRRMHEELMDKESRLLHHILHHILNSRIAKLEQFIQAQYEEFEAFEPEYTPIQPQPPTTRTTNVNKTPQPTNRTRISKNTPITTTSTPGGIGTRIKKEIPDYELMMEGEGDQGEEEESFSVERDPLNPLEDLDMEEFIPIHGGQEEGGEGEEEDSDEDFDPSGGGGKRRGRRRRDRNNKRTLSPQEDPLRTNEGEGEERDEEGDVEGEGEEGEVAKRGRRRLPIWECFISTFSSKGKVLRAECRGCGKVVSPKPWRMQMHVVKCPDMQPPHSSITLSRVVRLDLHRFKANLAKEKEKTRLHNLHQQMRIKQRSGSGSGSTTRPAPPNPIIIRAVSSTLPSPSTPSTSTPSTNRKTGQQPKTPPTASTGPSFAIISQSSSSSASSTQEEDMT